MQWFKFYGQDFLTDPKIMELNVIERSLWITLLCLYSSNGGRPLKITVDKLKLFSGMEYTDAQIWKMADQSLTHFEALKMITNDNEMITLTAFQRRQNTQLSPYERIKKFREKNKVQAKPSYKMITNDNEMITQGNVINDNARIDKKRIYKKEIDKEKETPMLKNF